MFRRAQYKIAPSCHRLPVIIFSYEGMRKKNEMDLAVIYSASPPLSFSLRLFDSFLSIATRPFPSFSPSRMKKRKTID